MTDAEILIRSIVRSTRPKLRPFLLAMEIATDMMYRQGISLDDIHVSKDIYPVVAKKLGESTVAVSRSIVRTANRCWEQGTPALWEQILGRSGFTLSTPSDLIFYLAAYVHTGEPVFKSTRFPSLFF